MLIFDANMQCFQNYPLLSCCHWLFSNNQKIPFASAIFDKISRLALFSTRVIAWEQIIQFASALIIAQAIKAIGLKVLNRDCFNVHFILSLSCCESAPRISHMETDWKGIEPYTVIATHFNQDIAVALPTPSTTRFYLATG